MTKKEAVRRLSGIIGVVVALVVVALLVGRAPGVMASPDAVSYHDHADIYLQAEQFLADVAGEQEDYQLQPIDSRVRLQRCLEPLDIDFQRHRKGARRAILEVRCGGETAWRIYLSATVQRLGQVVVVQQPLLANERIQRHHLVLEKRDLVRLRHGHFERLEQVEGMHTKRAVRADTIVTPEMLYLPNMVNKGDQVTIQLRQGGLQVQMKGVALEDGHRDGRVQVQNSSSGKVVEGIVVAPSRVVVNP